MKVLCLYNIPSPYRVEFCNELSKYIDLDVVFERKDASNRDKSWSDTSNYKFHSHFLKGIKLGEEQALSFQVLKFLTGKKYDLIIMGGYSTPTSMLSILYLKTIGKPYVLNADGGFIKADTKIKHWFKSFFIKNASAWLSSGKSTSEYFLNYGAKQDKIYVYPFSSFRKCEILNKPLTQEQKKNLKKELNIPYEKAVISVGQFIHRKGFDILLKSWQGIDDIFGLYIIGGKPTSEYLDIINQYNINNVHFIEFLEKETLIKYYRACDIFTLPTREDIWGLVVGEAMANGLPFISSNRCNSALQFASEGNGVILYKNNEKELNKALNSLLKDDVLLEKMSRESIETIFKYTIENMAKTHKEIFEKILFS